MKVPEKMQEKKKKKTGQRKGFVNTNTVQVKKRN